MSRMHHPSSKVSPLSGFSRLEAILILLILATLAFLALPVYNTIQANRQDKATDVNGTLSAPEPQSEVDNKKTAQPSNPPKTDKEKVVPSGSKASPDVEEGSDAEKSSPNAPVEDSQKTEQSPD